MALRSQKSTCLCLISDGIKGIATAPRNVSTFWLNLKKTCHENYTGQLDIYLDVWQTPYQVTFQHTVINSTLTSVYSHWNLVSFVKFLFLLSKHYLNGHNCLQWTQQQTLRRKLSYYSYFRERWYTNRRGDYFGRARGAERGTVGLEIVREWLWPECSAWCTWTKMSLWKPSLW